MGDQLGRSEKITIGCPHLFYAWSDRHRPKSMLIYFSKVLADIDEF
jgi:hypothetical protein